jgi:phage gpG-like protein
MAARFTFSVEGETQIDRTLAAYVDNISDATDLWDKLADRFAAAEKRQFNSEGGYGGSTWPDLSPAYAAWKSRAFPGKPILERTGELKRSLTSRPFGIEVLLPGSMVVGSGLPYGPMHQAGGGNLPRRRPVQLPESERRVWVRYIQNFLRTGEVRY